MELLKRQGFQIRVAGIFALVLGGCLVWNVAIQGRASGMVKQTCETVTDSKGDEHMSCREDYFPDPEFPGRDPDDPSGDGSGPGGASPTGGSSGSGSSDPTVPITPTDCAAAGSAPVSGGGLVADERNPLRDVSDTDRWKAIMGELVAQGYITSVQRDAKREAKQGKPVYTLKVRNDAGLFQGMNAKSVAYTLLNPEISADNEVNSLVGVLNETLLSPPAPVTSPSGSPENFEIHSFAGEGNPRLAQLFLSALNRSNTASQIMRVFDRYSVPLMAAISEAGPVTRDAALRILQTASNSSATTSSALRMAANIEKNPVLKATLLKQAATVASKGHVIDTVIATIKAAFGTGAQGKNDVGCHGGVSSAEAEDGIEMPTLVGSDASDTGVVGISFAGDEKGTVFRHLDWLEEYLRVYPARTVVCPTITAVPVEPGVATTIDLAKECPSVGRSPFGNAKFALLTRNDVENIPLQRRGFLYLEDGLAARGVDEVMPGDLFSSGDGNAVASLGDATFSGTKVTYKTSSSDLSGGGDLLVGKVTEPVDPDLGTFFAASRYFLIRVPIKSRPVCQLSDQTIDQTIRDGVVTIDRGESLQLDPQKICPNRYKELKTIKITTPSGTHKTDASEGSSRIDFYWDRDVVGDVGDIVVQATDIAGQSASVSFRVHVDDVVPQCRTTDLDVLKPKGTVGTPVSAIVDCPMPDGLVPTSGFGELSPLAFRIGPDNQFAGPKVGDPEVGEFTDVKMVHEPTEDDPVVRVKVSFVAAKDFTSDTFAQLVASNIGSSKQRTSTIRVHVRDPLIVCDLNDEAFVDRNDSRKKTELDISCKGKPGSGVVGPFEMHPVKPAADGKIFPTKYGTFSRILIATGEGITRFQYVPDNWLRFIFENQQETFQLIAESPKNPGVTSNPVTVRIKPQPGS